MIQTLFSTPPQLARFVRSSGAPAISRAISAATFVGSDPPAKKLGSGGGTVGLLHGAWIDARTPLGLWDWLASNQSLVLHAGGESRRLPAYASVGKAMLPVPVSDLTMPRSFDQTLADFQVSAYKQILREAGSKAAVLVASGDVWLEMNSLQIPQMVSDIAGVGMRVTPEVARYFGVFFVNKSRRGPVAGTEPVSFFLQKPSPIQIYRHLPSYDFYVDTGLWLLSLEAVRFLFRRCGWIEQQARFASVDGHPSFLDLYTELGPALGTKAAVPRSLRRYGWSKLATSVIPLEDARFFHLGSNLQLLDSFDQLSQDNMGGPKTFCSAAAPAQIQHTSGPPAWLDGITPGCSLRLEGHNILNGLPNGKGRLHFGEGECVEICPVNKIHYVLRPYALDDKLRGAPGNGGTICGHDAAEWLARREFPPTTQDVFRLPIYPVITQTEITQDLIAWFFSARPDPVVNRRILTGRRVSAAQIPQIVNLGRYFAQRHSNHEAALRSEFEACLKNDDPRVFGQDFAAVAQFCIEGCPGLRRWLLQNHRALSARITRPEHQSRFLALIAHISPEDVRGRLIREAYERLQTAIVSSAQLTRSTPRLALKEDQIVWARSPVRLDLAGGWTDTPPYCLEYGGAVVNLAVLLNGQPPIQVFVRPLAEPIISLRSIDLGVSETIKTYAALSDYHDPRSGFSLPKAALALAGFHPEFSRGRSHRSLRGHLKSFGGGLEISLLSAVPKGSGLGTSSILGATLLGALNRACKLGWDEVALYNRVLGVEQLLTTGGGWQDQAGALFRGIKLIQTAPGSSQAPSVRFLPGHLFEAAHANQTLLLYYTGITRLAKGILKEIVEDMFLGRFETLQTLGLIKANAFELFNALQQGAPHQLHRCIARSWDLNKRLDAGTSNTAIDKIIATCRSDLDATKLLGAGGGGYMLLCAPDAAAGRRIRDRLEANPPNRRARFIDFQLATHGLEVSVS